MTNGVFAVFDKKTRTYMQPFTQVTKEQAARSFGDSLLDRQSVPGRHPEDFALYQVGEFDDEDGMIIGFDSPALVIEASAFAEVRNAGGVQG